MSVTHDDILRNIALETLEDMVKSRNSYSVVVLCHGVFDILHIGHVRYLRRASRLGTALFVTITPDEFVNKGIDRPVFPENIRAEMIGSMYFVDSVAINRWPTAVETIELIRPDFYAKGGEYESNKTDALLREEEAIKRVGGKMVYIHDSLRGSSTELWRKHLAKL